jgi:hypothetical protein
MAKGIAEKVYETAVDVAGSAGMLPRSDRYWRVGL